MTTPRLRLIVPCAVVVLVLGLVGCGSGASDGPTRYAVSGKVTYAGEPVPAGEITFEPDASKGNGGPAASTTIEDGAYSLPAASGAVGGAMTVRIIGYDGKPPEGPEAEMNPNGMSLFPPYETTVDLPESSATQDFEVPK